MATMFVGRLLNNLYTTQIHNIGFNNNVFIQTRQYAARKGTRARREAKKIKKKIEKVEKIGYIERMYKLKQIQSNKQLMKIKVEESGKPMPVDNVWSNVYHRPKIYTLEEAVQCHRETHHPTMLNCPNSFINIKIELNLQTEKKAKLIGPFTRIVKLPHHFDHGKSRSIIAFTSDLKMAEEAKQAGATLAGGKELIKSIKAGGISLKDYEFCVAHPDMLADLILIRGLMKTKFPTTKHGTLSSDFKGLITKFALGLKYEAVPNKLQKDYGIIECPFGTLNMDTKHLEENLSALLEDVHSAKTKKMSSFILRTHIYSPPSKESLRIDFNHYLHQEDKKKVLEEEHMLEDEEDIEDVSHAVIPSH